MVHNLIHRLHSDEFNILYTVHCVCKFILSSFKPTLNALSFIHQVMLFDWYSDAFWCSLSPSSGSTILTVNFSKHQLVSNICLSKCCRNSVFNLWYMIFKASWRSTWWLVIKITLTLITSNTQVIVLWVHHDLCYRSSFAVVLCTTKL